MINNLGNIMFDNKIILIIGGIGLFGKKYVKMLLECFKFKKIIIFFWDELK